MVTQTLVPKGTKVTIEIPEEYLNRLISIRIEPADQEVLDQERRLEEIRAFFSQYQLDLSNFKFDREEANER